MFVIKVVNNEKGSEDKFVSIDYNSGGYFYYSSIPYIFHTIKSAEDYANKYKRGDNYREETRWEICKISYDFVKEV